MKLLITGGTGFFGKAVHEYLNGSVETLTISRTSTGPGFLTGDIRTVELPDSNFDGVLHMSLESEGTGRLLDWAVSHGVKSFLFTSSGAVYEQLTPYANAKQRAEAECMTYAHKMRIVIARCFAFVGPGIQPHFAIADFIRQAMTGNRIEVKGADAIRSYLYTSDLAEWLITLLEKGEGIYDVGSARWIGMIQLANMVANVLNLRARVVVTGNGGTRYVPDTTRAHAMGLGDKVSLPEAIWRTAERMEL